ncbi:MAG: hypothetical protein KatS3mg015_2770 [Fimbriimonadales bacterium]|nr:MAG: hypothetical protein KatS3mg015_2770 [Fimbriimonadales bacterium]
MRTSPEGWRTFAGSKEWEDIKEFIAEVIETTKRRYEDCGDLLALGVVHGALDMARLFEQLPSVMLERAMEERRLKELMGEEMVGDSVQNLNEVNDEEDEVWN